MTNIIQIQEEIKKELGNKEVLNALIQTTFKGLDIKNIYLAIQEGMLRGFTFKDFLEKNVYAIPFKGGYSLVTSIDYARKVGMRSGVVGKSAPEFVDNKDGKLIACTITIKRKVGETIGDYSATVYFDEYYKSNQYKNSLWDTKPRTMIAKVAEMHALRMACPEELAQMYTVEEMGEETPSTTTVQIANTTDYRAKLSGAKNMEELKKIWASLPIEAKKENEYLKTDLKTKFEKEHVTA